MDTTYQALSDPGPFSNLAVAMVLATAACLIFLGASFIVTVWSLVRLIGLKGQPQAKKYQHRSLVWGITTVVLLIASILSLYFYPDTLWG